MARRRSQRELIIWDTEREETTIVIQFLQKLVAIEINNQHLVALSKDKAYIYDLYAPSFIRKI